VEDSKAIQTKSRFHRKVFYVGAVLPEDMLAGLESRGWEVDHVAHPGPERICAEIASTAAGIVDFTQIVHGEWMALLKQSVNLIPISWIALVSSEIKQIPEIQAFIAMHCVDFITLPSSSERVFDGLEHALKMALLSATSHSSSTTSTIIGTSKPMRILDRRLNKAAMSDASVFLSGESGTGKELSARMLHERSSRRDGPFIAINCASMSVDLLHSELFGYERGAFTGALTQKLGRIEAANGGTLFLDEIGDLPHDCQSALLRFLQERRIDRLGATKSVEVDVRVVVATHVDMSAAINDGSFRADLFFRLAVLQIHQPPLRLRGNDINELASHALEQFRSEGRRRIKGFSADAIIAIHTYGWPGNVRELLNRVRRAIILSDDAHITADNLELHDYLEVKSMTLRQARAAAELRAIELAFLTLDGNVTDAAASLGISRVHLHRLVKELKINVGSALAESPKSE